MTEQPERTWPNSLARRTKRRNLRWVAAASTLVVAACGGDTTETLPVGDTVPSTTESSPQTTQPPEPPTSTTTSTTIEPESAPSTHVAEPAEPEARTTTEPDEQILVTSTADTPPTPVDTNLILLDQVHDDRLVAADYWNDELMILSAGLGFDNIIGVPDHEFETVRDAGATYYGEPDCVAPSGPMTSAQLASTVDIAYRGFADYDDGLPIVTSWPVLTSTVNPEDFLFTLNTGEQVVPHAAGMVPNWELNERNTMVAFGDFGNRGGPDDPDAVFPVQLEIVDDGSPLTFLGPDGEQSGVGLTWETKSSGYHSGPELVGAKLNHVGTEAEGEGGSSPLEQSVLPNDEFALYGGGDYRLRLLTSGGFSPDGLTGATPDQYEDFFRIHATGADGSTVMLTEVGVDYELDGGTIRVVGLADLGKPAGDDVHYDDCYAEDIDNYIDIILEGDEAAARTITHVEIPAADGYLPFYNPGGPGPDPFPGVTYSAPGPPDLEPVVLALDNPMRVTSSGS